MIKTTENSQVHIIPSPMMRSLATPYCTSLHHRQGSHKCSCILPWNSRPTKKSVNLWRCSTQCRSRQIFGGAKDFCPNSPKLARKKNSIKENDLEKKLFMSFWAPFLHILSGGVCSDFQGFCDLGAIFTHPFRRGLLRFSGIL